MKWNASNSELKRFKVKNGDFRHFDEENKNDNFLDYIMESYQIFDSIFGISIKNDPIKNSKFFLSFGRIMVLNA